MRISAFIVASAVVFLGCPPPSTAALVASPSSLTLDLGSTGTIIVTQDGTAARDVAWTSSDSNIVTVSATADGTAEVRAIAQGGATITASVGEVTTTIPVTVGPAVLTRIELSPGSPVFSLGTRLQLRATAVSSDGSKRDVTSDTTWRSLDAAVVTVASGGEATSVSAGKGTITADYQGRTASVVVTISNALLTNIEVAPTTVALITGNTRQLAATGFFSDGTSQVLTNQVTWSSSAPAVATVDSLGLVRAVTMGTATITATRGALTATTTVTTTTATLTAIELAPTTLSLAKGLTRQLTVTGRYSNGQSQPVTAMSTWGSSAASVATISSAGLLTAVAPGTATVTATIGTFSANLALTVTNAQVSSIVVTPAAPSLGVGRTVQLVATGTFTDGTTDVITENATWSSATPATASVSNATGSQGLVTAVAVGTSQVSATIGAATGRITVTVTPAELASIAVTPSPITLAKGLTQQFSATGTYTDSTTTPLNDVSWSSSDGGTLSITDGGLATALDVGVVTVSATKGAVNGTAEVTVGAAELVSIAVTPNPAVVDAGAPIAFTATGTFSDTTTDVLDSGVTWTSADAGVATVSSSGVATGVTAGETEITATHGAIHGSASLTVVRVLTSISVTPAVASVGVNGTQQYTAKGSYSDASSEDLTTQVVWSSSATAIATVDATGLATGHALGLANITATLGDESGSALLNVGP